MVCDNPVAIGGATYRWPRTNSGLAAPVKAVFNYQPYYQPLSAEYTGDAVRVQLPKDFVGGFNFSQGADKKSISEQYRLESIELRKPGGAVGGSTQRVIHLLEAALVHKQVGGSRWASVVLPLVISTDASGDLLSPLLGGVTLPTEVGNVVAVLISGTHKLDLKPAFLDANFLHFWGELPTSCDGTSVSARMLLRSTTLPIGQSSFQTLLNALQQSPEHPPVEAPAAWLVSSCPSGEVCEMPVSESVAKQLEEALVVQGQAVKELRERKTLMDKALDDLARDVDGAYQLANSARNDLRSAEWELSGVMRKVATLKELQAQADGAVFDSDAPGPAPQTLSAKNTTSAGATLVALGVGPKGGSVEVVGEGLRNALSLGRHAGKKLRRIQM